MIDIQKLADQLGLDVEDYTELIDLYIETTKADFEGLKTALAARDAKEVHRKSHSIKGSSGNMGLMELYETAKEINDNARADNLEGLEDLVLSFSDQFQELAQEALL